MNTRLIRKLENFDRLSDEEKQFLEGAVVRARVVSKGEDIIREGDRPTESTVLLEGFAARYSLLRNGKRQITGLHVPGDFVDLHSFLVKKMDHAVLAITPCSVGFVPHETLREISENHPHLTRLLGVNIAVDAAIHRQWIVAMGRRSALEHAAHLLCEMFLRLRAVGLTEDDSFKLPLTQAELGDALGLSTVHVNRVVQDLRKERLITWRGETLVIDDWERLQELAEFDPTFLSFEVEPR
ncbi:helix-turn-helix domain-containing protein [Microvirga makkahensis]|uniref:Helix-turn-helix domain-containing protein n=1 Tax=Microvirga makkahensis TaxID=1128670 RepID=A0A7X3MVT2_9HYPH|nr:Crp/Fnr family transcriptional regulator [Microvirga makkahensis]MXQ14142.1 helix-turn-helix domain-containing protein [Microvirga makkahensis]